MNTNPTNPTPQQLSALRFIVKAVVDAVKEAGPLGVSGGVLYAAMMTHGATFKQFESLMGGLVADGKLRRDGDLYFIGRE